MRESYFYERERERAQIDVAQWRPGGGHGFNPVHSTMASSELRDMYEVYIIERWEIWVSNPKRRACSVTTYR